MIKKNNDCIDVTKIILALMVVVIHSKSFGDNVYPFVRLAVPMFFIFSGYFSFSNIYFIEDGNERDKKVIAIAKRFLKLYLFWFVLLLPYILYVGHYFENGILAGIGTMIHNFFLGSTFSGSWYIMANMLGILIVYLLSKKLSNGKLMFIAVPLYLFATLFTEFRAEIAYMGKLAIVADTYEKIFLTPCFTFIIAIIYIVIGKIIAEKSLEGKLDYKYKTGTVICLGLLLLECYIRRMSELFVINCDCYVMLAPTAFFIVVWLMHVTIKVKNSKTLRNLSTIIYCCHIPCVLVISGIFEVIGFNDPVNALTYIITVCITVCVGLVFLKLEKIPHLGFMKYSH